MEHPVRTVPHPSVPRTAVPRTAVARTAALVGLTALALAGCGQAGSKTTAVAAAGSTPTAGASQREQVRAATAAFSSIGAANSAGYTVWAPNPKATDASCPTTPAGKMGYHLVNPALRGAPPKSADADATIDFAKPEQLLYAKKPDGSLQLAGVEYLVFKAAWEREHGAAAAPPTVLGQTVPASKHSFKPGGPEIEHYELHVWLHTDNPSGMFSAYNPAITC